MHRAPCVARHVPAARAGPLADPAVPSRRELGLAVSSRSVNGLKGGGRGSGGRSPPAGVSKGAAPPLPILGPGRSSPAGCGAAPREEKIAILALVSLDFCHAFTSANAQDKITFHKAHQQLARITFSSADEITDSSRGAGATCSCTACATPGSRRLAASPAAAAARRDALISCCLPLQQ